MPITTTDSLTGKSNVLEVPALDSWEKAADLVVLQAYTVVDGQPNDVGNVAAEMIVLLLLPKNAGEC